MNRILAIIFLTINFTFSQSNNDYKINTNIKIDKIDLEIRYPARKLSKNKKTLTGITIYRESDSISYFCKIYDYGIGDEWGLFEKWRYCENSVDIKTSEFDRFVTALDSLNIKKINHSRVYNGGCTSGVDYTLRFSGENYTIEMNTNKPQERTKDRGLTIFLDFCMEIWNLNE